MLYREIIAVCSQIHTKHINTLCGQNVELLNVKLAVHIVTTGFTASMSYSGAVTAHCDATLSHYCRPLDRSGHLRRLNATSHDPSRTAFTGLFLL